MPDFNLLTNVLNPKKLSAFSKIITFITVYIFKKKKNLIIPKIKGLQIITYITMQRGSSKELNKAALQQ
jgi:hypothetical protein